jgi:hypothetical protein
MDTAGFGYWSLWSYDIGLSIDLIPQSYTATMLSLYRKFITKYQEEPFDERFAIRGRQVSTAKILS